MTLLQLLAYALLSSTAVTDSDRMAAQMVAPSLEIVSAPQTHAPVCPKGGLCAD